MRGMRSWLWPQSQLVGCPHPITCLATYVSIPRNMPSMPSLSLSQVVSLENSCHAIPRTRLRRIFPDVTAVRTGATCPEWPPFLRGGAGGSIFSAVLHAAKADCQQQHAGPSRVTIAAAPPDQLHAASCCLAIPGATITHRCQSLVQALPLCHGHHCRRRTRLPMPGSAAPIVQRSCHSIMLSMLWQHQQLSRRSMVFATGSLVLSRPAWYGLTESSLPGLRDLQPGHTVACPDVINTMHECPVVRSSTTTNKSLILCCPAPAQ